MNRIVFIVALAKVWVFTKLVTHIDDFSSKYQYLRVVLRSHV